jgi:hypothetical protein
MYIAPRRFGPDRLDARVPLSIARWHRHVRWCVPKHDMHESLKGETEKIPQRK